MWLGPYNVLLYILSLGEQGAEYKNESSHSDNAFLLLVRSFVCLVVLGIGCIVFVFCFNADSFEIIVMDC